MSYTIIKSITVDPHQLTNSDSDRIDLSDPLPLDSLSGCEISEPSYQHNDSVETHKFDSDHYGAEEMDIESVDFHPRQYIEQHHIIPLPELSQQWYER